MSQNNELPHQRLIASVQQDHETGHVSKYSPLQEMHISHV